MTLAKRIEHTLLRADADADETLRHCAEAVQWQVPTVCILPGHVRLTRSAFPALRICTVVNFPDGASLLSVVHAEIDAAFGAGADHVDVVAPLDAVAVGSTGVVEAFVRAISEQAHGLGGAVKIILESSAVPPDALRGAAVAAVRGGADYLKTSTGLHPSGGATPAAVAVLRQVAGDAAGVKASGGIRHLVAAQALIAAGADLLGTSATVTLLAQEADDASSDPATGTPPLLGRTVGT